MNSRQYGEAQTHPNREYKRVVRHSSAFKGAGDSSEDHEPIDKVFAGSFKELRATLSGTIQPLGTAASPALKVGAVRIAANGAFRNNVLTLSDVHAISKSNGSEVSAASFQVNLSNERILSNIPHVESISDFAPDVGDCKSERRYRRNNPQSNRFRHGVLDSYRC
jgi:hypothetical protein